MSQGLARLSARHRRVAQLLATGTAYEAIAEEVDAPLRTVKWWAIDPLMRAEVETLQGEATSNAVQAMALAAFKAVDFLRRVLSVATENLASEHPDPRLMGLGVRVACAILDRAGLAPYHADADGDGEVPESLDALLSLVSVEALEELLAKKREALALDGATR